MENPTEAIEKGPERVPTKQEVVEIMMRYTHDPKGLELSKESSDEKGLYVLEIKVSENTPGETTQYEYVRRGRSANIHAVYFRNGVPVGGKNIADYDPQTGDWQNVWQ